jgi:hypothetical protein
VATNQIRDVSFTMATEPGGEGGHALAITIEISDPVRLIGLLEDVVVRFKHAMMTGPRDTRFMLITVIGEISAQDFAQDWHAAIANDAPARALLGTLHQADVMQGDAQGRMVAQVSLLAS